MRNIYEEHKEIIRYIIAGALTTLVNFVIYFGAVYLFNAHYALANILATIIAILVAFILNKAYVFQSKSESFGALLSEFIKFIGLRLISGLVETGLLWLLIDQLGSSEGWAKLIGQVTVVILNYIFSKRFVFT